MEQNWAKKGHKGPKRMVTVLVLGILTILVMVIILEKVTALWIVTILGIVTILVMVAIMRDGDHHKGW